MSVQTEIDRISTAVQNAHLKVIEKGGTSAAPYLVANLPDAIDTIPEATEPKLQTKSATPSETAQTVKPDSGYDGLSQVSVGAISKTYVGSGVTKQAAQTITPGTANKTIASGRYLTGTQTIKGDANLVAGNIKSGVSIFGVAGTMTAGEDVTAETNTYTGLLDDLEAAVDALPDAGSGSGGSVETCTVTIKRISDMAPEVVQGNLYFTGVDSDGNLEPKEVALPLTMSPHTTNIVCVKNTMVHFYLAVQKVTISGGTVQQNTYYNSSGTATTSSTTWAAIITDDTATVTIKC